MKLEKKKQIVEELREKFSRSKIIILTDYKGLNVSEINDLRGQLKDSQIEYRVVKNSLLARAAEDTDVAKISESFTGPSAIALSYDDPVAPAKVLKKFAEDKKKLEIKIGIMEGSVLDPGQIQALSELPSQEVLLAKLLSVLVAVPSNLVNALADAPRRVVNVLQAIQDQKEKAEAA